MIRQALVYGSAAFSLLMGGTATATVIEDWQFNETANSQFTDLVNDAGSASWGGNAANALTTGPGGSPPGALEFTQGADNGDNIFRTSTLTNPDQASGLFQFDWRYLVADLSTGDATGANLGFGMRDESGTDLFIVRLHKQSDTLRLQTRIDGSNDNLVNFGTDVLADTLTVRAVADLDNDTLDVFYTVGVGAEQTAGTGIDISFNPSLEFDQVRLVGNTNSDDWGATDSVAIDYLTVTQIPEPSSLALLALTSLSLLAVRRRR